MDSKIMDVLGDRVLELGPKSTESGPYRNFRLTHDGDGIAWLLFDRAGASANSTGSRGPVAARRKVSGSGKQRIMSAESRSLHAGSPSPLRRGG